MCATFFGAARVVVIGSLPPPTYRLVIVFGLLSSYGAELLAAVHDETVFGAGLGRDTPRLVYLPHGRMIRELTQRLGKGGDLDVLVVVRAAEGGGGLSIEWVMGHVSETPAVGEADGTSEICFFRSLADR